jgi:outer membrane usher protein
MPSIRTALGVTGLAAAGLAVAGGASASVAATVPTQVSVRIQGRADPAVPGILLRGDAYVAAADLRALGLTHLLPAPETESRALVPLSRLHGIGWSSARDGTVTIILPAREDGDGARRLRLMAADAALGEVRAILHDGVTYLYAADLQRFGVTPRDTRRRLVALHELPRPLRVEPAEARPQPPLAAALPPAAAAPAALPAPASAPPPPAARAMDTRGRRMPAGGREGPRTTEVAATGALPISGLGGDAREAAAAAPGMAEQGLALLVTVNGAPPRFIVRAIRRDGTLLIRRPDLVPLRLRTPAEAGTLVALSDIPGLTWRIRDAEQVLELDVPLGQLVPEVLEVDGRQRRPVQPATTGAVLTYDVEGQRRIGGMGDGHVGAYGFFGANAFSPYGTLTATALARGGDRMVMPDPGFVRLDTAVQVDDPERAWAYRLGDVVTGGGENRRRIRLGGAQWASDYLMRPDIVTYPRPFLSGTAALPSTVDFLINGVRTFSAPVGAGPFELREIPALIGPNAMSVTLRDAQGMVSSRIVEINATRRLLAPGLTEHSVEAGAIRRRYGFASNDYGRPVGSGTLRYGLTDRVTLSSRTEIADDLVLAGLGATVGLGPAGSLSFEPTFSSRRGQGIGTELSGRWEFSRERYSASVGGSTALGGYSDLAGLAGDPTRRRSLNASLGVAVGDRSFAGITMLDQKLDGLPGQRIALASYTANIGDAGAVLGVNAFTSLGGRDQQGVVAYLSMPLGPLRGSVGGGSERGAATGRASIERQVPFEGGLGWRLATQEGSVPIRQGEVRLATDQAEYEIGAAMVGQEGVARARTSGSVVMLDGVHLQRAAPGSMALVETGLPGLRVTRENRPAGTTDAAGRLLLTGLQPYAENRIAIDPLSLPMNATASTTAADVVPPRGAAVRTRFDIAASNAALIRLRRPDGAPVAQDSVVAAPDGQAIGQVGLDGELFLTQTERAMRLVVADAAGPCQAEVTIPANATRIPVVAGLCAPLSRAAP